MKKIILASASPRRSELMKEAGFDFTVMVSGAEENITTFTDASDYAAKTSFIKGKAVLDKVLGSKEYNNAVIVAADTVVCLENKILEKPNGKQGAFLMLKSLSGKTHYVTTGVSVFYINGGEYTVKTESAKTFVTFRPMTDREIEDYVNTGEPLGKSGSYAIQGGAKKFVEKIDGDITNVVGLPMELVKSMIGE